MVVFHCRGAAHLNPYQGIENGLSLEEFANGEIRVVINRTVRAQDVVIVQSFGRVKGTNLSINDLYIEALLVADAVRRAGCKYLTVIFPLMPYSRQDRKHMPGVPLSAKVVCDGLMSVGIDRFITFDLHADQIQGFMPNSTVFDHLSVLPYMCNRMEPILNEVEPNKDKIIMCSPDAGAITRTKKAGSYLGIDGLAIISKLRSMDVPNQVTSGQLVGKVRGKTCILVDDMVDTAGSLVNAYSLLKNNGADKVIVVAVHGILSANSLERLRKFDLVIFSDTVTHVSSDIKRIPNSAVVSIKDFMSKGLLSRVSHKLPIGVLMTPKVAELDHESNWLYNG